MRATLFYASETRWKCGVQWEGLVGFYSRVIFPWICDRALGQSFVMDDRRKLLAPASGRILEIGFGTGLNLPCYPATVRELIVIDPNLGMHRRAERRIKESQIRVEARTLSGEQLPFDEGSFDYVVSTFTLCSVAGPTRALAEAYRVLRPGGQLLFLEHGLSPEPAVEKWQHRLNWLQQRLGDGCNLDRPMKQLIGEHSFASIECSEFYLQKTPKTHGYIYRGSATK